MGGNLLLSRKPMESIIIFAGGERIEIETRLRTLLAVKAEPSVRVIRKELEQKEEEA